MKKFILIALLICGNAIADAPLRVTLSKWNGEARLTLIGVRATYAEEVTLSGFCDPDCRVRVIGWEDFNFYVQPALNIDRPDCTMTDCDGHHRPVNIVDSIAVYHKTFRDHQVGGTNYETGKFGHVKRPRFTTRDGRTGWGSVAFVAGELLFHSPFREPSILSDTLGDSTQGASTIAADAANYIVGNRVTASANGTLQSVSMWLRRASSDGNVSLAVYNDDGSGGSVNAPGATRRDSGSEITTIPVVAGVITSSGFTQTIVNGTAYWLTFNHSVTADEFYDTTTIDEFFAPSTYSHPTETPIPGGGGSGNLRLSIYATYTVAASTNPKALTLLGVGGPQ